MLRIVVAGAQRLHRSESAQGNRCNGGLGATGEHCVGIAHDQCAPRLSDGVAGSGAGGAGGQVGSTQAVVEREHPRSHVDDHHRDEER